jgi:hypothetical protein
MYLRELPTPALEHEQQSSQCRALIRFVGAGAAKLDGSIQLLTRRQRGRLACSATIKMDAALPRLKCSRRLTRCLT